MASVKRQITIAVGLLATAVAITWLLYQSRPSSETTEPVYVPVTVDVVTAVRETIRIPIQAQGTVSPLQRTTLVAEVEGRIVEVADNFHVGGYVEAGAIMLRIDPRDYETALARAQAALKSAESALLQEQGQAEVALQEWRKLPKGSQRSEQASDLYLRKPQLAQAQAQLLAASADVKTAQDNLDRCIVRAPYDALIRSKDGELGQYLSQGATLAEVVSVDFAEVRLPIPQTRLAYMDLPRIRQPAGDTPIDLYTDVGGEQTHWSGVLHRSEGVYDERSRVLFAVARIEDPYALQNPAAVPLRIGAFVNANIAGKPMPGLVALPRHVLRAGDMVPVVDADNRVRNRRISSLRTGGDLIYVSAGLENGDLVILTALDNSLTGSEVRVMSRVGSDELRQQLTGPGQSQQAEDPGAATAKSPEPPQNGHTPG